MSDVLINAEIGDNENDKIKVASAEIVVHGTPQKPYYEIRYYDLADGQYHIGYSSYYLDYVFEWFEKYFDIVEDELKKVRPYCGQAILQEDT